MASRRQLLEMQRLAMCPSTTSCWNLRAKV